MGGEGGVPVCGVEGRAALAELGDGDVGAGDACLRGVPWSQELQQRRFDVARLLRDVVGEFC